MIKLSIIVPVYNVEKYLRKCVDSILAQDYSNYEIILVDDGSTDGSGAICDSYVSVMSERVNELTNERIRVIHQENGGLSAARNSGIKVAQGEYICFLDSDDYWLPNKLGALMTQIEQEQLDVLRFDHNEVRLNKEGQYEVFQPNKSPHYVDRQHDIVDGETYLNERMGYACYVGQFLMKRNLILDDRCLFTPGIHFEDVDWLPRMMLQAKRVNSTEEIVYSYLQRPGSITQTQGNVDKIRNNVNDCMYIIEYYGTLLARYPQCSWLRNMQSCMVVGVIANIANYLYSERYAYLKRLKQLQVFPLSIADQSGTYLRKAKIINFSPKLAMLLLHIKNINKK